MINYFEVCADEEISRCESPKQSKEEKDVAEIDCFIKKSDLKLDDLVVEHDPLNEEEIEKESEESKLSTV